MPFWRTRTKASGSSPQALPRDTLQSCRGSSNEGLLLCLPLGRGEQSLLVHVGLELRIEPGDLRSALRAVL